MDKNKLFTRAFGPIGITIGFMTYSLTGNVELSVYLAMLIGMPTWFMGVFEFSLAIDPTFPASESTNNDRT